MNWRKVDLFTFTADNGCAAFAAGDQRDGSSAARAAYCLYGTEDVWVLYPEREGDLFRTCSEAEAVLWVAAVPRD